MGGSQLKTAVLPRIGGKLKTAVLPRIGGKLKTAGALPPPPILQTQQQPKDTKPNAVTVFGTISLFQNHFIYFFFVPCTSYGL